jgi:hypothetical protein
MQSVPWDGKKIREASIVRGLPLAAYHDPLICEGGPSVSSSLLRKLIQKSPAHAFETSPLNPNYEADANDSEAMALGRFLHKAVAAEPFDDDCVLCPPTIRGEPYNARLKVWKDWKAHQNTLVPPTIRRTVSYRSVTIRWWIWIKEVEGIKEGIREREIALRKSAALNHDVSSRMIFISTATDSGLLAIMASMSSKPQRCSRDSATTR